MNEAKPDIVAVMEREGLKLRRAGKSYRGKCNMHDGKSHGSLAVYPDSQSWYCWGCAEGGDAIDFIMKLKGYSFKDACRYLNIIPGKPAPVDPAIEKRRQLLKAFEQWRRAYLIELCDEHIRLHELKTAAKKRPLQDEAVAWFYAESISKLPVIHYQLEILSGQDEEAKFELYLEDCHG